MHSEESWRLPDTPLYSVHETEYSGRAVFAEKDITAGQPILTTSDAISPVAHVVLRPYRREVCAQCFAYDRGREWKIRSITAGVAFCSEECQLAWRDEVGIVGFQAHEAVERWVKQQQKRTGGNIKEDQNADTDMTGVEDGNTADTDVKLTAAEINGTWQYSIEKANHILSGRASPSPSKSEKRAIREATDDLVDADVPFYLLSGVLTAYHSARAKGTSSRSPGELIPSLVALVEDTEVFASPAALFGYIKGFLLLLAILPIDLIDFMRPELCQELAARASHNAFSIRPTADGEHSGEFLGWGVWPEASFNNHSCGPNLKKERRGRIWHFVATDRSGSSSIKKGDELCITYLGGDEWELDVVERRKRLRNEWGFECCCARCTAESNVNGHAASE